jgi:hypothetical protein
MIPYLKKNYAKAREMKSLALSVIILDGTPNIVMTTSSVDFFVGIYSTHLVK